jgi:hypothetical protein
VDVADALSIMIDVGRLTGGGKSIGGICYTTHSPGHDSSDLFVTDGFL